MRPTNRLLPLLLVLPLLGTGCDPISRSTRTEALGTRIRAHDQGDRSALASLGERVTALETRRVGSPGAEPGAGARRVAPASPVTGGTYRLALATDPPTLDPVRIEDTTSFSVACQVLEGLLEFDEEMNLVPVLAKRWSVSEDRRSYTFDLHQGVRFHNGREVTAEDFAWSFARNLDPKALGVRTYLFDRILGYPTFSALTRVGRALERSLSGEDPELDELEEARGRLRSLTVPLLERLGHPRPSEIAELARSLSAWADGPPPPGDPVPGGADLVQQAQGLSVRDFLRRGLRAPSRYRFVVELAEAFAPFAWNLPMVNAAVVPREEVERLGDAFSRRPVGSGPFRLVDWEPDVALRLEAFEDYFQGRPHLDRIEYRILSDPVTRLVEYQVGNLDSIHQIPDEKFDQIRADPPGELVEYPLLHVFYLGMNAQRPPFDDVRVRRAFQHAISRELILAKIKKGRGVLARGPLPPAFRAYDPELPKIEYSPEKARALLTEAGYGPTNPLRDVPFWFNTANGADANAKIAEVVQADLKAVGVELTLQGMAWGTYLDRVHRCEAPLFRLAWLPSHPNGDSLLYALFRSGSASNACCYQNHEVDSLLDQARSEHDEARRVALYRRAQRKIMLEDAAWIPIYHAREEVLKRPWVKNLRLNARGMEAARLRHVWLEPRKAPGSP